MSLNKGRICVCLLATAASLTVSSQALAHRSWLEPYIAIDRSQRDVDMVSGLGKGLFQDRIAENDILLGIKVTEYLGLEAGWTFSEAEKRTALITGGTTEFGIPNFVSNDPNNVEVQETSLKFNTVNLNLVGYIPTPVPCTSILLKAGLDSTKITARSKIIADDLNGPYTQAEQEAQGRLFKSTRVVPKVAAGVEYQLLDHVALRAMFGYVFTTSFRNMTVKNRASIARISFKQNTSAGLGLTFQF